MLDRLFGAYLNQDYDLIGESDEAVISVFKSHVTYDELEATQKELAALIREELPEEALIDLLDFVFGCGYLPPGEMTHRHWLRRVEKLLASR